MTELCGDIQSAAGAVLLSGDTLADPAIDDLADVLDSQPAWSAIPVVLFMSRRRGAASLETLEKLEVLRDFTLLDSAAAPGRRRHRR